MCLVYFIGLCCFFFPLNWFVYFSFLDLSSPSKGYGKEKKRKEKIKKKKEKIKNEKFGLKGCEKGKKKKEEKEWKSEKFVIDLIDIIF